MILMREQHIRSTASGKKVIPKETLERQSLSSTKALSEEYARLVAAIPEYEIKMIWNPATEDVTIYWNLPLEGAPIDS